MKTLTPEQARLLASCEAGYPTEEDREQAVEQAIRENLIVRTADGLEWA